VEYLRRFEELGVHDTAVAGGKGANLGELTQAGMPVPPGFVITAAAYVDAIEQSGVREKLQTLIAGVAAADERTATRTSGPRA